jgi:hypothetical protein
MASEKEQPAERMTRARVDGRVRSVEYIRRRQLIVCIIELDNGVMVVGENSSNEEEVGKALAYNAAISKVWNLEMYLLADKAYKQRLEDVRHVVG